MTVEKAIRYIDEYLYCNFECDSDYMDCKDCGVVFLNADFQKALQTVKEILKKQIPKKITEIHCDEYYCPNCGAENNCDQYVVGDEFCPHCGQKLDRSENNDI